MNGIHDLGGMHGLGPVPYEPDEPVFHDAWEGRLLGLDRQVVALRRIYNRDEFRHGIERMEPARYLAASCFCTLGESLPSDSTPWVGR